MSENNPTSIAEFLFNQRSDAHNELLIKTKASGEIEKVMGNGNHFSPSALTLKTPVTAFFPFLNAFLPARKPQTIDLPHINIGELYVDIQILSEKDMTTWILFSDVTREVNQVEDVIRKNNERALKHKTATVHFTFDNPFGNLQLFDVASFLKTNKGKFILLGAVPKWLEHYFPQLSSVNSKVDIVELFPYLEVFIPEARLFWETEKENLKGSDMWIENPNNTTELHFRAFATNKNGNHYLMIRLLDQNDNPLSQQTIQKAREHQLLYEKLKKAEKELKQLLNYKDKFVSIVSHDLRSPMASVVSIAELLLTDEELLSSMSDFNREMLQSMKEELLRLLEYNNRLYHWANLELGNFKLDIEKISAKKLIESISQTAQAKVKAKNIRYEALVAEDFEIEVDVSLFMQALNNLIGNAIKFTPENGHIILEAIQKKQQVRFVVSDSGVGIPEKIQKSLFSGVPNESSLGTSGEKGSGLGLDIVKKIIDAHGATIEVQSEKNNGTTFIISLSSQPNTF